MAQNLLADILGFIGRHESFLKLGCFSKGLGRFVVLAEFFSEPTS